MGEQQLRLAVNPALSPKAKNQAWELFETHSAVWKQAQVGRCSVATHSIDTGTAEPVAIPRRKMNPMKAAEVQRQVEDLLSVGAIEECSGPSGAPVVLVRKGGGDWRMCVDYRSLNAVTVRDTYPLPRIDALMQSLAGARVFTSIHLKAGCYQIPVAESDRSKTAFVTASGTYQFKVMHDLCEEKNLFSKARI